VLTNLIDFADCERQGRLKRAEWAWAWAWARAWAAMYMAEPETVKPIRSDSAWDCCSFAWARGVLCDLLRGRVSDADRRQATLSNPKIRDLLIGRSGLDECINFSYKALKSHRDGRSDDVKSITSIIDVVFVLAVWQGPPL
jgi:hypothetical protein